MHLFDKILINLRHPKNLFHLEFLIFYGGEWAINSLQDPMFLEMYDVEIEPFQIFTRISIMCGFALSLAFGWLADSYIGKVIGISLSQYIWVGGPILMFLNSIDFLAHLQDIVVLKYMNYFIVSFVMMEGVRTALILEQAVYSDGTQALRRYIFYLVFQRYMASFVYGVVSNIFPPSSGVLASHSLFVIAMYVVYVSIFTIKSIGFITERVHPYIVEKAISCIFIGVVNQITNFRGNNREHWLDRAETRFSVKQIFRTKLIFQLFKTLLPLISYGTIHSVLRNINEKHSYYLLSNDRILKVIAGTSLLSAIKVLLLPITECILFFYLKSNTSNRMILQHVSVALLLIGGSLITSAMMDIKLNTNMGLLPKKGYGSLDIFNALSTTITFKAPQTIKVSILPHNLYTFKTIKVLANSTGTIENGKNQTFKLDLVEFDSVSYVVTSSGVVKPFGKLTSFIGSPGNNDPKLSRLRILPSETLNDTILEFKNQKNFTLYLPLKKLDRSNEISIPEGKYTIKFNGPQVKSAKTEYYFGASGVYTLYLYRTVNLINKIYVHEIVQSLEIHYIVLLFPHVLAAAGDSMARVSVLHFTFLQAPAKMRALAFAFAHFILNSEIFIVPLGGPLWNRKVTLLGMIVCCFVHAICYFIFVNQAIKYKTISQPALSKTYNTEDEQEEIDLKNL